MSRYGNKLPILDICPVLDIPSNTLLGLKMKTPSIIIALLVLALCQHASADEFNVKCPAKDHLYDLDVAYHECRNGYINESCEDFVFNFSALTPRSDCRRSFDTNPVPAIWLANSAAFSDYLHLLTRLVSKEDSLLTENNFGKAKYMARQFFGSSEFRGILDGHYAEDYYDSSIATEREMQNDNK